MTPEQRGRILQEHARLCPFRNDGGECDLAQLLTSAEDDGGGEYPTWADRERMTAAIRTVGRLLIDYRDNALAAANRINATARQRGLDFDRRADSAEGAAGAYSVAISALTGALGARSIEDVAAEPLHRDMERPTLPSEITEPERTRQVGNIVTHHGMDGPDA